MLSGLVRSQAAAVCLLVGAALMTAAPGAAQPAGQNQPAGLNTCPPGSAIPRCTHFLFPRETVAKPTEGPLTSAQQGPLDLVADPLGLKKKGSASPKVKPIELVPQATTTGDPPPERTD